MKIEEIDLHNIFGEIEKKLLERANDFSNKKLKKDYCLRWALVLIERANTTNNTLIAEKDIKDAIGYLTLSLISD